LVSAETQLDKVTWSFKPEHVIKLEGWGLIQRLIQCLDPKQSVKKLKRQPSVKVIRFSQKEICVKYIADGFYSFCSVSQDFFLNYSTIMEPCMKAKAKTI